MSNASTTPLRLATWISNNGCTRLRFSIALGVDPSMLSHWLRGRGRPSIDYAAAIEVITGIPARDWADPAIVARVSSHAVVSG